jgi:hypothetical protein
MVSISPPGFSHPSTALKFGSAPSAVTDKKQDIASRDNVNFIDGFLMFGKWNGNNLMDRTNRQNTSAG